MKSILKLVVLYVVLMFSSGAAVANELATRAHIDRDVQGYYLAENFAALEAMASEFRASDARTSSGLSKLHLFYSGVAKASRSAARPNFFADEEMGLKIADRWVTAYPNSPTAALAKATARRDWAWQNRGAGPAKYVTQEQFGIFLNSIEIADDYLRSVEGYANVDSYYYYMRAHNLNELGADEASYLALMDEGLTAFPDAYQLYFAGVDYFAPKWNGSAANIEGYARSSIRYARETDANALYARIYWYASQTQYGLGLFAESDVVWADMRTGIKNVLSEYPDQWNIQNFAVFACAADDAYMTRELLTQIEGRVIVHALRNPEVAAYCKDIADL